MNSVFNRIHQVNINAGCYFGHNGTKTYIGFKRGSGIGGNSTIYILGIKPLIGLIRGIGELSAFGHLMSIGKISTFGYVIKFG